MADTYVVERSLTINASPELLHFLKPFKSTSSSRFSFSPEADGTKVVWTMTGQHNWLSKVMGVFINMDKMLGKDFEQGLSNLKSVTAA